MLYCLGGCLGPASADDTDSVEQFIFRGDLGHRLGSSVATGSTQGATNDFQPSCGFGGPAGDAAYTWTAPAAGLYVFSTSGSSFDTILDIRQYNTSVSIGCNDDSNAATLQSTVGVNLAAGQTVLVVIDGYFGEEGTYQLSIGKGGGIPSAELQWWLRSDVGVTGAERGAASRWESQTSNGFFGWMPLVERQPRYVANAINGLPVLEFNGGQSIHLENPIYPEPPAHGPVELATFTLFVVGKNNLQTESFNMILGPDDSSDNSQVRWDSGSEVLFVGVQSHMPIVESTIGNTRVYHALSASYDGAKLTIYRDGTAKSAAFFTLSKKWILAAVGSYKSSSWMVGDLAEVIIYERALSEAERLSVNAYLKAKYNLP
jgi:hypothetical protein